MGRDGVSRPDGRHRGWRWSSRAKRREELAEAEPVAPVPLAHAVAILDVEHLNPKRRAVVAAMVRFQLLTGMRSGGLCSLRANTIDRRREPWRSMVTEYNKLLHKSLSRVALFGPRPTPP